MRWGVRKASKRTKKPVTVSSPKRVMTDAERFSERRAKDLENRVRVLNLERQLASLSEGTRKKGNSRVKRILADIGEQSVRQVGTNLAVYGMNQAIRKAVPGYPQPKKK